MAWSYGMRVNFGRQLQSHYLFKGLAYEIFAVPHYVVLFYKGHLYIYLREFRLPVRAQILVAKARTIW